VNSDLTLLNKVKQRAIVVENTKSTANPESRVPRLELRKLRVRVVSDSPSDIVTQSLPEVTDEESADRSSMEEVSYSRETVFLTPRTRAEPSHPSNVEQLIKSLLERCDERRSDPDWSVSCRTNNQIDCCAILNQSVSNVKGRLGTTDDNGLLDVQVRSFFAEVLSVEERSAKLVSVLVLGHIRC
jgi:hypothetical protein